MKPWKKWCASSCLLLSASLIAVAAQAAEAHTSTSDFPCPNRPEVFYPASGGNTRVIQFATFEAATRFLNLHRQARKSELDSGDPCMPRCIATNAFYVDLDACPEAAGDGLYKPDPSVGCDQSITWQRPSDDRVVSPQVLRLSSPCFPRAGTASEQVLELGSFSFDPVYEIPLLPEAGCLFTEDKDEKNYAIAQFEGVWPDESGFPDREGEQPDGDDRTLPLAGEPLPLSANRHLPGFGLLLKTSGEEADQRRKDQGLRWIEVLHPAYKIDPAITLRNGVTTSPVVIRSEKGGDLEDVLVEAGEMTREQLFKEALKPGVWRIDRALSPVLRNATTSWVIQSNLRGARSVFGSRGQTRLRGEGQVIGLIDDLIDVRHCFFHDPARAAPGPLHRKLVSFQSRAGLPGRFPADVHGTFAAGILAGQDLADPGSIASGQASESRIAFSHVGDLRGRGALRPGQSNLAEMFGDLACHGAEILSNSWGDDRETGYSAWAYDVDRFMHFDEEALAVFAVSNGERITTPENARNALAVGASRQAGFQGWVGSGAPGPTCDDRLKPEIFAPGCRIESALAHSTCETGELAASHAAHSLSHGVQEDCTTSWAAPAVAAAGALVKQYFKEGYYPHGSKASGTPRVPSGALVKAVLLNGTEDMAGVPNYPSDIEGWGRLLLENALFFTGDPRALRAFDLPNRRGMKKGDPPRTCKIEVTNKDQPLKVTLAWIDLFPAPFARTAGRLHDLDLIVKKVDCDEKTEKCFFAGNHFESGVSVPLEEDDLKPDGLNNVEQVLIKDAYGKYEIWIKGTSITSKIRQGFALVASGVFGDDPADFCR